MESAARSEQGQLQDRRRVELPELSPEEKQAKYRRDRIAWRAEHPPLTREELEQAELDRIAAGHRLFRDPPEEPMDRESRRAYIVMILAGLVAAAALVGFIRWTT